MTLDIKDIHNNIFDYLLNVRRNDPSFYFSLRRSNREGRLENGYWFHGNDHYVAVSFWSGNDWKNRTPNIIFVALTTGKTYLEVNVTDSSVKRRFAEDELVPRLNLQQIGKAYRKEYYWDEYMPSIMEFVHNDKTTIDNIINDHQSYFGEQAPEDRIGFIDGSDFEKTLRNTLNYRELDEAIHGPLENRSLHAIAIKNFGPIKEVSLNGIPFDNQWIFLTGENGTGKTTLLRAIAILVENTPFPKNASAGDSPTIIEGSFFDNTRRIFEAHRTSEHRIVNHNLLVQGFAAYGTSRLTRGQGPNIRVETNVKQRLSPYYNLTNSDGLLFDLLEKYTEWERKKIHHILSERFDNIREVMHDLIPNLSRIKFELDTRPRRTLYIEEDTYGNEYEGVPYYQLASGIRSMVAMFGDMMCRLFDAQPEKTDPSELTGVVLIDEIDLHLHPKLQKILVEQLSKTFHKIQFIATTHSPIPLLGASIRSKFFKVKRTAEEAVEIVDLSEIKVFEMLPTAILTSDLFDMNGIFIREAVNPEDIRTEETFSEIKRNDTLKAELEIIANRLKGKDESNH
ncbi:MAG: AAA family ATPase [Chitinophaga sp.]|uniref:AAA family ATPase n=1 Tax=Chitinophaga sp. TaxID=1869181 RepID=UPI001B1D1FF9|nr:AAA family ATPase [Chitinophaga sp.]MBO9733194.1 AAA family ATPase [Chitinophaga sp.]